MDLTHLSENELANLLAQPTILSQICTNLTFEQAVRLRSTLRLNSLDCPISIFDKDHRVNVLPRIDDVTIQIYRSIKSFGSSHALSELIKARKEIAVMELLNLGVNIEVLDKHKNNALIYAIINDLPRIVKELLNRGANLENRNWNGSTPLILAIAESYDDQVFEILLDAIQKLPNPVDHININGWGGKTAFMTAIHTQTRGFQRKRAEMLLKRGADIEGEDDYGSTALNYVSGYVDTLDVVNFLLDSGANIATRNETGETPLHTAAYNVKNKETIITLLNRGADINAIDIEGRTPLMTAANYGNLEIVETLVEYGANTRLRDRRRKTAKDLAKENKHVEIVNYLSQYPS